MSESLQELGPHIGVAAACVALQMNRTGVYRQRAREMRAGSSPLPRKRRPRPPLSLSIIEQQVLLEILNSERFADMAPASIFATLLDEGRYHGGIRTMYRLLAVQQQSGERRRQRVHPVYAKPELLAIRANEVWSWDITKRTPRRCRSPPHWGNNA